MIDKNPSHNLGSNSEKMGAALPLHHFLLHQLYICLVDQLCRLKGVVGALSPQLCARQPSEFVVYQRD